MDIERISVTFKGNVSSFKTDGRTGGMRVVLDVFETEKESAKKILDLMNKNVEAALVLMPDGE